MPTAATSDIDVADLGSRAETMIMALGAISAEPDRLTRLFLTREHRRAADLIAHWMRDAKLAVTEDALGTVRGHLPGAGGKRLLIGSHFDTVINAGLYDGNFGVVAGILAAEHFSRRGRKLPFGVDVLAFGDEEGVRFPVSLSSSLAVAGAFNPQRLELADNDGISFSEALTTFGKDPAAIPAAAYPPGQALAYVEVHIEQGPVLEAKDEPLGIVTGIAGQTYLSVELDGEAGHAGTVPMPLRRDALVGAAELVASAEALAREPESRVVATVGRLNVEPNAPNVIPARVVFTLDLRSTSDPARRTFAQRFRKLAREMAEKRNLGIAITQTRDTATVLCDDRLQDLLSEAVSEVGGQPLRLPSGAGHDGHSMAKLCPVGMLFVRCRGGVSHNPLEYASPPDMGLAVAALVRFIERFDSGMPAAPA